MKQIEENVIESFRLAKSDIIQLQNDVIEISQTQERVMEMMKELKAYEIKLYQRVRETDKAAKRAKAKAITKTKTKTVIKKIVAKQAPKVYLASKAGNKFHIKACPFAQNIKPKNTLKFKSKTRALNQGFKPCKCIK